MPERVRPPSLFDPTSPADMRLVLRIHLSQLRDQLQCHIDNLVYLDKRILGTAPYQHAWPHGGEEPAFTTEIQEEIAALVANATAAETAVHRQLARLAQAESSEGLSDGDHAP